MIAYFDCFSGISGDMTLGALIDLGLSADWLEKTLKSQLGMDDFSLKIDRVRHSGIESCCVNVEVRQSLERDYQSISQMISESRLSFEVKQMSLAMFDRLADAEAEIHGCPKSRVHFHEVGGVDAIVDMVGTALGIDYLGIKNVYASPLPLGSGTVTCSHGTLPVPAPATVALLQGVPVYGSEIPFELVTPTGAAIITTLAENFGPMPDLIVDKAGYGAGKRQIKSRPNLLRILTGSLPEVNKGSMFIVETCIDDMNPELYGYVVDRIFALGARDVYIIPVFMKKGRPGVLLQVLCDQALRLSVISEILTETSAIGVRYYRVERHVLEREKIVVDTLYGLVYAKRVRTSDGTWRISPEYDSCRQVAESANIALSRIYEAVVAAAANGSYQPADVNNP